MAEQFDPDGLSIREEKFELFPFIMLIYYFISPYVYLSFTLPSNMLHKKRDPM